MATNEPRTPIYGPPMSSTIFATKWLTKHRNLLQSRFVEPLRTSPTPHPIWIFKLCYDAVEHLIYFYGQAQSLNLTTTSFPDAPARTAPITTNAHLYSPNDLPSMKTNPFLGAETLMLTADGFMQRLKVVKDGATLDGLRWEYFPLEWRVRMEDVFEIVQQGEKDGWWRVKEEFRRSNERKLREKEERDFGRRA